MIRAAVNLAIVWVGGALGLAGVWVALIELAKWRARREMERRVVAEAVMVTAVAAP